MQNMDRKLDAPDPLPKQNNNAFVHKLANILAILLYTTSTLKWYCLIYYIPLYRIVIIWTKPAWAIYLCHYGI